LVSKIDNLSAHAESPLLLVTVINEACAAFEFNTGLFEVIEIMVAESTEPSPELESSREEELVLEMPLETEGPQSKREYSVASVAAFIAAGTLIRVQSVYQLNQPSFQLVLLISLSLLVDLRAPEDTKNCSISSVGFPLIFELN